LVLNRQRIFSVDHATEAKFLLDDKFAGDQKSSIAGAFEPAVLLDELGYPNPGFLLGWASGLA
jgi:hypothetical protein